MQNKTNGLGKDMTSKKKYLTTIFLALVSTAIPASASNFSNFFSGGKVMYLVAGDGVTKIGPLVSYTRYDTSTTQFDLVYISPDTGVPIVSSASGTNSATAILGSPLTIYYSGSDCTGTPYLNGSAFCPSVDYGCFNPNQSDGAYLIRGAGVANVTPQSLRSATGVCTNYGSATTTYYTITAATTHPLCGAKPCKLKLMTP